MNALNTVIAVNYNSSFFLGTLIAGINRLAQHKTKIYIADNGSCHKDLINIFKIANSWDNVAIIPRQQKETPSLAHGRALDHLMKFVETPFVTVMDADATFLLKNWDTLLMEQINNKVCAVGTPITKGQHLKPTDFPLMFATMYKTEVLKKYNCSFCPVPGEEAKGKDTGWEIREAYLRAGLEARCFVARTTRDLPDAPFGETVCAEYYHNSQLIASHFGRGSSAGAAKYCKHLPGLFGLTNVLRKQYGRKERARWIAIANAIITQQSTA
jgi:hypothetical protein